MKDEKLSVQHSGRSNRRPCIPKKEPHTLHTNSPCAHETFLPMGSTATPASNDPTLSWVIDPSLLSIASAFDSPSLNDLENIDIPDPTDEGPLHEAIQELEMAGHAIRDTMEQRYVSDTTTKHHYQNYVNSYIKWFDEEEFKAKQTNPNRPAVPALPVTAAKVCGFLQYTMERPKRDTRGNEIPGTTVGKATVQSIINALERERSRSAHKYPSDQAAQKPLRNDIRIRDIERYAKHNEPQRIALGQARRLMGTGAETYTEEQMMEISLACLQKDTTLSSFKVSVRDRALYLLPLCTAFRGDNIRQLALADLYSKPKINVDAGQDKELMCMHVVCNNAKHNQLGKSEEQGAIRHRHPELCCIGALALHFFATFHLSSKQYNWAPEFSNAAQKEGCGEYGKREWWSYKVFPSGSNLSEAMTYTNHATRIHSLHDIAGAKFSKVTHAQRYTAAYVMRAHGTGKQEVQAVGWSVGDSFNGVYDKELPIEALLGAAMFNAKKPETHFLARDTLVPPSKLVSQIFPWVEKELDALDERERADYHAQDLALRKFLTFLQELRVVLLQDLAVLHPKICKSFIYTHPPFNTPEFRQFSTESIQILEDAEREAQLALRRLPEIAAGAFRGAMEQSITDRRTERQENVKILRAMMEEEIGKVQGWLEYYATESRPTKRRKLTQPIRSMLTAPPIPAAIEYREGYFDEEAALAFTNGGTVAVVSAPKHCDLPGNGPLSMLSINTQEKTLMAKSIQPDCASISPQLGVASQKLSPEVWANNWAQLLERYQADRLAKHMWDWEENQLVPHYDLQPVKTFEDVWKEYTEGLNGFLPFREIKERWSTPAWHRNIPAKKTPASRRKKITDLVETLSKRPHSSVPKVLNFLNSSYGSTTVDAFARKLHKPEFLAEIMSQFIGQST